MLPNLDRYKKELDSLLETGRDLEFAMPRECSQEFERLATKQLGDKARAFISALPSFRESYQVWYSEAKALIRQLLPDRLTDFVRHYEKPPRRKDITAESYRIEDYLQGLVVTRGQENQKVVGCDAAIPQFQQQLAILKSVRTRFESSLMDIRQLAQADLFDSELDAAKELASSKFTRAAGAVAGVVLERHLLQVCSSHGIRLAKKGPKIADLNNELRDASVIDLPQWPLRATSCGHS